MLEDLIEKLKRVKRESMYVDSFFLLYSNEECKDKELLAYKKSKKAVCSYEIKTLEKLISEIKEANQF